MKCKTIFQTLRISSVRCPSVNVCSSVMRRCYGSSCNKNPYDILGLKNNCSIQDVKRAYIKLCKQLHPDMKPGDASQHKKFVELNNAYTTLVNAESRRRLDRKWSDSSSSSDFDWKQTYNPFNQETGEKDRPWYEQEEYRQYSRQPYSINTTNQFHNTWTLMGCFFLVIIGSILTFSAYRYGTQYTLNIVNEKSKKISESYKDVREDALGRNKEEKIEEMKKRWNL